MRRHGQWIRSKRGPYGQNATRNFRSAPIQPRDPEALNAAPGHLPGAPGDTGREGAV
jgi:hypothetical protein